MVARRPEPSLKPPTALSWICGLLSQGGKSPESAYGGFLMLPGTGILGDTLPGFSSGRSPELHAQIQQARCTGPEVAEQGCQAPPSRLL